MRFDSKKKINYLISLDDSLLVKGLAICLMLMHHLFDNTNYGDTVYCLAYNGKVCVSLFIFLSAYGLAVPFEKEMSAGFKIRTILTFYFKRYLKLYLNFWSVFIITVPIGIYCFGRTLTDAYGEGNAVSGLILDFFGLASYRSYNITWWFYQAIIFLYLAFPFLYYAIRKVPFIITAIVLGGLSFFDIPLDNYWTDVTLYYRIFSVGIIIAIYRNVISQFLNRLHYAAVALIAAGIIGYIVELRYYMDFIATVKADIVTSLSIIILAIIVLREIKYLNQVLMFLGKHSMNIFMTHTFLYLYFFHDYIYCSDNFAVIFSVLLASSLSISILLEFVKTKLGLYRLIDKAIARVKP